MIGNTIRANNPHTEYDASAALPHRAEDYPVAGMQVDFLKCKSLEDVIAQLMMMDEVGLHLVGSADIVWHSGRLAEIVTMTKNGVNLPLNMLTRTGSLRATVYNILKEKE